jgi:hypothetical protein
MSVKGDEMKNIADTDLSIFSFALGWPKNKFRDFNNSSICGRGSFAPIRRRNSKFRNEKGGTKTPSPPPPQRQNEDSESHTNFHKKNDTHGQNYGVFHLTRKVKLLRLYDKKYGVYPETRKKLK